MATRKDTPTPTLEELQAQLTQAEAEKLEMEKRLAEAEKAGSDALAQKEQAENAKAEAEAQAQAAKSEAEEAKAEAERVKAEAEAAKKEVEAVDADGLGPSRTQGAAGDTISRSDFYDVYCKIPAGMTFPLPDGRKVKLSGVPLAQLMDSQGRPLPGSGYGKTTVAVDDWLYIRKTWGSLPAFRSANPVIFARAVGKGGEDQAVEQAGVTSGFEQIKVDGKDKAKGLKTEPAQR